VYHLHSRISNIMIAYQFFYKHTIIPNND